MHDVLLNKVVDLIEDSGYLVALTGAGVSTEAGIPDFRSPETGLWTRVDPSLFSAEGFRSNPRALYEAYRQRVQIVMSAKPTRTHRFLALLEKEGKLRCVITQNIDGLHQKTGSREVIELHGNLRQAFCTGCGLEYAMEELCRRMDIEGEIPPICNGCGEVIKPGVVLFGDPLPEEEFNRALEESRKCDLMLILGSSLVIYPAADLPRVALAGGAKLAIINLQPTEYDPYADVVLHERLGDTCELIATALSKSLS